MIIYFAYVFIKMSLEVILFKNRHAQRLQGVRDLSEGAVIKTSVLKKYSQIPKKINSSKKMESKPNG